MSTPRVVIVDDHVALRKGVEALLERAGLEVAGSASDAKRGYDLVRAVQPEVAIVDLNLPDEDGISLTQRLLDDDPELGVLLYTGADDTRTLVKGLDCGARGFVLKAGAPEELVSAVQTIAGGGEYVDPALRSILLARDTTDRIAVLSPREREIFQHLANGLNGEGVARHLFLSPETIRTHVRNAMRKLQANTRTHAIVIALRHGDIDL
jgi:DNA-binding NarL/FixJ family response regulator